MKKLLLLSFMTVLLMGFIACGPRKIIYKEGSYEGLGHGHHGPINVIVNTDPYEIKGIEIIEEYEMPELSKIVYEEIPRKIMKTNSADVDVVAGASYTSEGLIEAIRNGLNKAKVEE